MTQPDPIAAAEAAADFLDFDSATIRSFNGRKICGDDIRAVCAELRDLREQLAAMKAKTAWRDAIGCAPGFPGSISPEEAIRRGRE